VSEKIGKIHIRTGLERDKREAERGRERQREAERGRERQREAERGRERQRARDHRDTRDY
jgi:hypothetical protein